MRLRSLRLCAGFSECRSSCSAILDPHEVTDLPEHACEHRRLVVFDGLADPAQPERPQRAAVLAGFSDHTPCLSNAHLVHDSPVTSGVSPLSGSDPSLSVWDSGALYGRTCEIERPRLLATSSGRRSRFSPSTVALAMLIGLVVPGLFARRSR